MQSSLPRIFARSQQIRQRCFFKTAARQRPGRSPRGSTRTHEHADSEKEPSLGLRNSLFRNSNSIYGHKADMSNLQWWTKPAPIMSAPSNQQPSGNGFKIPGLGNAANIPFASTSAVPLPRQSAAGNQSTMPKGPRGAAAAPHNRDKIIPPSAASGGVPEPTPQYLQRASLPPTLLSTPRPILIVMDLNGTLLYRPNRRNATTFVERPHAKRFLQYCLDTFHVVVWSSAQPKNVQSMCDQLLLKGGPGAANAQEDSASYRRRVLAVWGRDKFGLSDADFKLRVQVYKRLEMVWAQANVQAAHPDAAYGGRWDQTNTVLVDDSLEKARSEPYNLLRIPEFFGDASEPGCVVPQVHDYLNQLCNQSDISAYMRTNPFKLNDDYRLGQHENVPGPA
ncbi:phosphoprotein phosphatase [Colletotrichum orchidophilum]|uniref:Mitochondrial import inner membrane translocase subunit TIM50 n=1 Tax=Colletotrichum orchidophilum TaxID=1209926 RepID=A0A1G4AVV0_9PEZI|nr:phosphoprotein phosphatase [Colletotrichum orchidophilum]OHE93182.1 phosphoprotein phosphatase [Colletotrichum orchidophilum]